MYMIIETIPYQRSSSTNLCAYWIAHIIILKCFKYKNHNQGHNIIERGVFRQYLKYFMRKLS